MLPVDAAPVDAAPVSMLPRLIRHRFHHPHDNVAKYLPELINQVSDRCAFLDFM
jgi:hypothetical protein